MGNITDNRINTLITETDIAAIKTNIEDIKAMVPAIGLTPNERKSLRGIDVANKAFVEDCINMLKMNGNEIMPDYIKPDDIINDYGLFEQLDTIKSALKNLISMIETTQRVAGRESVMVARNVYELYGIASAAGIGGAKTAHEKLSERFDKQKGRRKDSL